MKIINRFPVLMVLVYLAISPLSAPAQSRQVAITIDDIPFASMDKEFDLENILRFNGALLRQIDSLHTPVTAFITGRGCTDPERSKDRIAMLQRWIDDTLITLGNHTMNHLDHSSTDLEAFEQDVNACDTIIHAHAGTKPLHFFRFPYNALGAEEDTLDHDRKQKYLMSKGYEIAPFTIESLDYVFDKLYVNALKLKDQRRADSLGEAYIKFTLLCIAEAEQTSRDLFGRNIPQIFLCHDSPLQSATFPRLIARLVGLGYRFISLDSAVADSAYATPNYYFGKYGISWLYRWMPDAPQRMQQLRAGVDIDKKIINEYKTLSSKKN